MLIASSFQYSYEDTIKRERNVNAGLKEWLGKREESGTYASIFQELRLQDAEHFRKYLRVNTDTYEVSDNLKNTV